jgi:CBS domain-containing protein
MISNMAAYGLARRLSPLPIYDALLEQDGIKLHATTVVSETIDRVSIANVKLDVTPHITFSPDTLSTQLLASVERGGRQEVFPVLDDTQMLVGIICLDDLVEVASELADDSGLVRATDLMRPPVSLDRTALASAALETMMSMGLRELPIVDENRRVLGMIDEASIAREYMRVRASERATSAASSAALRATD